MTAAALPPVVDADTWQRQLDALRAREKAATRELDAIAAQRRRLPMVKMPDYTLEGEQGPIRLADVFDGKSQLIVYNHMWFPGEQWQCPGCTGFTSQFTRLEFLDNYDARFVIVTQGPIEEALAYKRRVGNKMTWYSTANSPFGSDVGAPPGGGFAVNVFLRDGDTVYRTWHTNGRGTEQLSHTFALIDLLPYGRHEEWQDSPEGWPQSPPTAGGPVPRTLPRATGQMPEDAAWLRGHLGPVAGAQVGVLPDLAVAAEYVIKQSKVGPGLLLRGSTAPEPGPMCRSARARTRSPAGPCRSRTSPCPEPALPRSPPRRVRSHAPHLP
jgi:predicted dithiol-disulfide oxidoreductase (DUF899 family)